MYQLRIAKQDTSRVLIMSSLSANYQVMNLDSAMKYGEKALTFAQQIKYFKGEALALYYLGQMYREKGDLPKALKLVIKAMNMAEEHHYIDVVDLCNFLFGTLYFDLKEYPKARGYYQKSLEGSKKLNNQLLLTRIYLNIGVSFTFENQLDSAKYYTELARQVIIKTHNQSSLSVLLRQFGRIQVKLGNNILALDYFKQGIQVTQQINDHRNTSYTYNEIAKLFLKINQLDSCIFYAKKGLTEGLLGPYKLRILESSTLLTEAYKTKNDFKQAYTYQDMMIKTKESLYAAGNIQAIQTMIADDEARRKEVETEKIAYENQLRQYGLLAGLAILLLIAFFLNRNNQKEKKAKNLLQEQKEKVESTLSTLKSTQTQLIQFEKLASLGELTAGIAHEIQNPLNFVNNFSELSGELIDEMNQEIDNGNLEEVKAISGDLKQNLEKINLHGKRASSIVKGMLEHSRVSTGKKELTDINALTDEYLRLAYHGLHAKDKDFNVILETHFDENLPKTEVIPQDIGRVLLNLINNAFYAVNFPTISNPTVSISTQQLDNQIIIKVKDNGTGMSEATKTKIFQPFFTTKPTGQGTGLGLSLAYDIITKGHGGTIEVESVEGVGSEFIIYLPIKNH